MDDTEKAAELFFAGLKSLNDGDLVAAERCLLAARELVPGRSSVLINLSIVYSRMGRIGDALPPAEQTVANEPRNPLALLQLGAVQLSEGRLDEALATLDAAIASDGGLAAAHNARGSVLQELRQLDDALASYDAAIRLRPDYAEALSNRGGVLRMLKRHEDALASLRKSLALRPNHAEAHNSLGNVLSELNRQEEALGCYDKALALNPGYAEALDNRGNALRELGRLDSAEASFRQALTLRGEHPGALLGLARIASETGRFAAAIEAYGRARELDPQSVEALCGLAENRTFTAGDPLAHEIENLLLHGRLTVEERARLHHACAKICNDSQRFDEAMAHFSAAKELLPARFDAAAHARRYAGLTQIFDRSFFAARTGFGLPDERPVFVVGMPRSGTTLTEQILASHHAVRGLGELPDLPRIARVICADASDTAQFAAAVSGLTSADVRRLAQRYCEAYRDAAPGEARLIDKQPHNYEWLGLIALMFPQARIIHCRRDPLDTCVSMYMQKFNESHGYNRDLATLGRYYRSYEALMQHWNAVLPLRIFDSGYEATVADLEASARSLVAFLGLPWDPNCLAFHRHERQIDTPSRWQVRQPLYGHSIGRWRRYERHLGPLQMALQGETDDAVAQAGPTL